MQPVLTSAQSRAFDDYLIEKLGIPAMVLMENAAHGLLEALEAALTDTENPKIAIFAGTGNNGGDGLALARLLFERGYEPKIFIAGSIEKLSIEAKAQYDILQKLNCASFHEVESVDQGLALAAAPDIIVDALLGTGGRSELKGSLKVAVESILRLQSDCNPYVVAIDSPTGLDVDSGAFTDPACIRADTTVTMAAPKVGFYQGKARSVVGEIMIAQLGAPIPETLWGSEAKTFLVERGDIVENLPTIEDTASKFTRGRLLALCGSRGMTGAAIMSATAALRTGCGLVDVAVPKSERSLVAQAMPELLTVGCTEQEDGAPDISAWDELQEHIERADALLIGSGLRPWKGTAELLRKIIAEVDKPMVIDAGALGALVGHLDLLKKRTAPTIITPHTGEMARLVERPWEEVEQHRLQTARQFAVDNGVVVAMKGAPTYTIDVDGTLYINSTGNAGLATAGSGDVLAGIMASMLVQMRTDPVRACMVAVYLHGLAGDFAAIEKTKMGMTATDVTEMLPRAFKELGIK